MWPRVHFSSAQLAEHALRKDCFARLPVENAPRLRRLRQEVRGVDSRCTGVSSDIWEFMENTICCTESGQDTDA